MVQDGEDPDPGGLHLDELVERLEADPEECRRAFEGLEVLDPETRHAIVEGLGGLPRTAGVGRLLRMLGSSHDPSTRDLANQVRRPAEDPPRVGIVAIGPGREIIPAGDAARPQLLHSVVTTVNGEGRGTIGLSTTLDGRRRTALFLCDVSTGLIDAVGREESESPEAGALLREAIDGAGGEALGDVPELALRLLATGLRRSRSGLPASVGSWLRTILGPLFPATLLGEWNPLPADPERPSPADPEDPGGPDPSDLLRRAGEVLEACPGWLDRSALTQELGEEIVLREGRAADPMRDSGAYRFLFEHVLIHRMETYRGMLSWMSLYWRHGEEPGLAESAAILARELADEQNAVPSHPFVVAISSRSLDAAIGRKWGREGPAVGAGPRAVEGEGMDRGEPGVSGV
ncbi:hypothetical protein [Aquisphaera insulae]|uniref:hypothetical protein n=1 Tax=Aquisphaera insulae TaxID=2712864 RepID=UPI0013E9ACF4|nr:hypothetical protein [Aquisphaera insulae]